MSGDMIGILVAGVLVWTGLVFVVLRSIAYSEACEMAKQVIRGEKEGDE